MLPLSIFSFFSLADRSFNDLTQYPVFPWILADYKSEELGKMSLIKRWFRLNILATIQSKENMFLGSLRCDDFSVR